MTATNVSGAAGLLYVESSGNCQQLPCVTTSASMEMPGGILLRRGSRSLGLETRESSPELHYIDI